MPSGGSIPEGMSCFLRHDVADFRVLQPDTRPFHAPAAFSGNHGNNRPGVSEISRKASFLL